MSPLVDADGQPIYTVVYVHGIGNKPVQSILKCQWDRALFGIEMGDRSRLAYWVDRERHPEPTSGHCGSGDLVDPDVEVAARRLGASSAVDALDNEIDAEIQAMARTKDQARLLRALAKKIGREPVKPRSKAVGAKVLPLPAFARRWITGKLTKAFLGDVNDFLFDDAKRTAMERSVTDRLTGPGPYIVVAHSQGSMIAYEVLRKLKARDVQVPLLVTIGSPLGMAEVQDVFKQWTGKKRLAKPACVARWVNVADRLDPVALGVVRIGLEQDDGRTSDRRFAGITNTVAVCVEEDLVPNRSRRHNRCLLNRGLRCWRLGGGGGRGVIDKPWPEVADLGGAVAIYIGLSHGV